MPPARARLIVNPAAGGGRAGRREPEARRALESRGISVASSRTRSLEHARELAREAVASGEIVIALSGDGLIGAIADELRGQPGSILGLVPGGRGNDLARVLGIPDDPDRAAEIIAAGHTRPVDLGLVTEDGGDDRGRAFVGIASVGFDSEANRVANEAPAWLGGLVYAYGALRALVSWSPARFEIELDPPSEPRIYFGFTVGAANSKCYGGGMRAAPGAMLDDGLLEVVVLESVSKKAFLTRIMPKVFSGRHVLESTVSTFAAAAARISADRPFAMYADGDPIGQLPVTVRALPGAITMLLPREDPSDSAFSRET